MARELTKAEIIKIIDYAKSVLPDGVNVTFIFSSETEKGTWVNRASTSSKEMSEKDILSLVENMLHRDTFGTPNQN